VSKYFNYLANQEITWKSILLNLFPEDLIFEVDWKQSIKLYLRNRNTDTFDHHTSINSLEIFSNDVAQIENNELIRYPTSLLSPHTQIQSLSNPTKQDFQV
jgi:hypothetical protein